MTVIFGVFKTSTIILLPIFMLDSTLFWYFPIDYGGEFCEDHVDFMHKNDVMVLML